jgi:hypothetical protein
MAKLYDLAVVTRTYEKNGESKKAYLNIGAVMEKDGKQYMMLNRHFNPAGVPHRDGSDTIMVSMFEPRDDSQKPSKQTQQFDDDTPF